MKKLLLSLGAFALVYTNTSAQCPTSSSMIDTMYYKGAVYELIRETATWKQAAACAKARGGYLAEVDTKDEQDTISLFISTKYPPRFSVKAPDGDNKTYIWLGGNDIAKEGDWVWDGDYSGATKAFFSGAYPTGTVVTGGFANWGSMDPDNAGTGQHGLGMAMENWSSGTKGQWNDIDTGNAMYYLIEYPKAAPAKVPCGMTKTLIKTGATLSVAGTWETYQWVKCPSYAAIAGATASTYTVTDTNSYAVIVTGKSGTCIDTSNCAQIKYSTSCGMTKTLTLTGSTISVAGTWETYQWVKCPSWTAIPGATSSTYMATAKGDYAVIVSGKAGMCRDSSNCISYVPTGIDEYYANGSFGIATIDQHNGMYQIFLPSGIGYSTIKVYNTMGLMVSSLQSNQANIDLNLSSFASGIYVIAVENEKVHFSTAKVMKL